MSVRGWVYVLSNKSMPGLVKIGYSTKDPQLRAEELEGTGLPHPFVVEYDVLVIDPRDVEQAVHTHLQANNERKEFFRIDVASALKAVRTTIASQNKSIIAEYCLQPVDEPPPSLPQNEPVLGRVVLCPNCKTENRVTSNRFVCKHCREFHTVAAFSEEDPKLVASRNRIFPASPSNSSRDLNSTFGNSPNPAATWPFPKNE